MPKRILQGVVVSDACDKTVIVEVQRRVFLRARDVLLVDRVHDAAHDEANLHKVGETVRIEESRPISKRKRWIVLSASAKAGSDAASSAAAKE